MGNDVGTLKVVQKEELPDYTYIHQAEDGTILYFKRFSPYRLYVKWQGQEFDAELPYADMECIEAFGNSTYLKWHTKIYKATFIPPDEFAVSYFRDVKKNENITRGECIIRQDGKTYCYRLSDNPLRDRIPVDVSSEHVHRFILDYSMKMIHRGKVVYFLNAKMPTPSSVRMLSDNVIAIELFDAPTTPYSPSDSSPLIYFACDDKLFTLDTESLQFMPTLQIEGVEKILSIAGIRDGLLTVRGRKDGNIFLITGQLPKTHTKTTTFASKEKLENDAAKMPVNPVNESLEAISDQCSCSICSEIFDSRKHIPRVLDCGHTFCEVCIYNDKMFIDYTINCPNCSRVIDLSGGKELPINYFAIGMAEQTMKSRIDPKVTCKACNQHFSSTSVRMCVKEDCARFNQLICLSCVVDGGHMGHHVVKYDAKMEKIREKLREDVNDLVTEMDEKKTNILLLTNKLSRMVKALEKNLSKSKIPSQVIAQLEALTSEEDADEYREKVQKLAASVNECDIASEALIALIDTANGLDIFDSNAEDVVVEDRVQTVELIST